MKKIRWAVIGAGGIADRRGIPGLLADPKNEIVAMMDKMLPVAKQVAEKYLVSLYFDDAEEMLKAVKCDAVYIATPVFCHYDQAMLALKYGIHAFIEKPLAMNAKECKKIVDAFKKKNLQLTVGYMMGYHNLHGKMREIIKNDGIGRVSSVRFQFSCWYPDIPGAWRQKKALGGGGCIMDLAVHCMELYTSVTGDRIEDVMAYYATNSFKYEVEDSAVIIFKGECGSLGSIEVNFNVPDNAATSKAEIYGTKGSLIAEATLGQEEVGKLKYTFAPQGDYEANQDRVVNKARVYYGNKGNIYTKQFAAFNKLITSGKPDYTNAENAINIQSLCDKIYSGK